MNPQQPPYGQPGAPPPQGGYYPGYQPPPPGQTGQPHNPGQYQPGQQQYGQPPQGQYAPPGQPPQNYQGQQPQQYPPQQYPNQPQTQPFQGQQAYAGQPPAQGLQGQQPQGYPGQPPQGYQGQPQQGYQGQPPQSYQGQTPQSYQGGPPQGHPGQPPPQPYAQQPYGAPPGQVPYGQHYNPGQPPTQQYGGASPPHHVWQQPAPPALASPGYDPSQKHQIPHVDTTPDVEALRKAMKGMGCDERALIKVFTSPKYSSPWAMQQLVADYNKRFIRDLVKDIKSETRGDFEDALVALIQGPLETDVKTLDKAMDRAGTDETALADVLLCRSNADIRAVAKEYETTKKKDLSKEIKSEVDETLHRLYSMALGAQRAEPWVVFSPADLDRKVTEIHQATEGVIGSNAISVAQILVSSNEPQIRAINDAYQQKYHRSLQDVIEKEFRGDTEDALLHMLLMGTDRARADAEWLRQPLTRGVGVKHKHFIYRITTLYWNKPRLEEAKQAYERQFRKKLTTDVKEMLGGDYEDLVVALVGGKQ